MAIAYYIPDQAKLLAGHRNTRGNNNSSRSSTQSQQSSRLQQNARGTTETANSNPADNRGYGTTINITVPTYTPTATPQEPLGCWDFLTQVFCHALRFYHESSQLQPTVIQISVNFNSNMPATNAPTNTTVNTTTSDTAVTTTLITPPTASYSAPNEENGNNTDQKQLKSTKRKN